MSDEQQTRKMVDEMAQLAILSGKISDAHQKSLKTYPFIFFDGVKTATIDYDLSSDSMIDTEEDKKKVTVKYNMKGVKTGHMRVSYYLEFYDGFINDHQEKRFTAIENAVRTLFWKDVKVEVFFNNKLAYPHG